MMLRTIVMRFMLIVMLAFAAGFVHAKSAQSYPLLYNDSDASAPISVSIIFSPQKKPDFAELPNLSTIIRDASTPYKPGLELREQVDQLLLFPLIMQEIMSDKRLPVLPLAQSLHPDNIMISGHVCAGQDVQGKTARAILEDIKAPTHPIVVDAIIEQRSQYISRSTTLYVRYWISSDNFYTQILWSEPNYGPSVFSLYPRSLTISDSKEEFKIEHPVFNRKYVFPKINNPRPDFSYPFYNYPIQDIRYYAYEYRQTGIDLTALDKVQAIQKASSASEHNVITTDSRTNSYVFINGEVNKMIVNVPESYVMVGGVSKIKYSQGNKEGMLSRWPAVFRQGGRRFDINFRKVNMLSEDYALPDNILIFNASTDEWMQRMRLLDYRELSPTEWEDVVTSGISTANFNSPEEKNWRNLRSAMWDLNPTSLTRERAYDIQSFEYRFKRELDNKNLHSFDRIRLRDQLAWLGIVSLFINGNEDVKKGLNSFALFMAEFVDQGNPSAAIQAGRSFLEYMSNRETLTPKIKMQYITEWANQILKNNQPDELLLLIKDLVNSGENWLALYLFVGMSTDKEFTPGPIQLSAVEKALKNIQTEKKTSAVKTSNVSKILIQNMMTKDIAAQLSVALSNIADRSPKKVDQDQIKRMQSLLDSMSH